MSHFLLELYSEEIPHGLQIDTRQNIEVLFNKKLTEYNIAFKKFSVFSTPTRLCVSIEGLPSTLSVPSKEIKGPKVGSPEQALAGFLKSNQSEQKDVFEKTIDKGNFYFVKTKKENLDLQKLFATTVPEILQSLSWKKSMRWANHSLVWGRPLKSILSLFDNHTVNFNFHHLSSSNKVYVGSVQEEKQVNIKSAGQYFQILKDKNIILDQNEREKMVLKSLSAIFKKTKSEDSPNLRLVEEVTNLVDYPTALKGSFSKDFLELPEELLHLTMMQHQRYFPMKSLETEKITNTFVTISNNKDEKKLIIDGNERVLQARLSDAKFFWDKNKRQNLVKNVSKLNGITFYKELGSLYDKTQRVRQLASLISDIIGANKGDTEIAASICKADLVTDLVGEYPELQGVIGKYFAISQGFSSEIANAISDHYLPLGPTDNVPKEKIAICVALADKLDTLIGFFGIGLKPTSSKDPFALRRAVLGIIRIIIENKLSISLKELINNAKNLYLSNNIDITNAKLADDLIEFFNDRFKNLLKDKNLRLDVVDSVLFKNRSDDFYSLFLKITTIAKYIKKPEGMNAIATYKRAKNILEQNEQIIKDTIFGNPDVVLFNSEIEETLLVKINEIKDYFTTPSRLRDSAKTIQMLSEVKLITDQFFEEVKVNDDNEDVKKNRLELLLLMCKTFDNFTDFSKFEGA
jgi:glycyl-tRNA synthetase beta chain|tara:strand:+ start:210 stop:2279 length:2070 start_codon:yes stop_codon:yes gene_type:complete